MTTTKPGTVSVSRCIDAPAEVVFALLANPARHPSFDGSGMLLDTDRTQPLETVGDTFVMRMHNDEMGAYEMLNHVVVFDRERRWVPAIERSLDLLDAQCRTLDVA